jgi:DNA adenine methylase
MERLQSLESLERLERLERLEDIEFMGKSYEEVPIPDGAIVYCDPPYQGTATYAEL